MTSGVVAGGHPLTVQAGVRAFELGGNAFDAAVAAQLTASVCEPLLTGLGGGGMANLRVMEPDGPRHIILDLFSNVPGLSNPNTSPVKMESVLVDFGADKQPFKYGAGSVSVPGMVEAIWHLHSQYGTIPLIDLARPAIDAVRNGLEISVGLHRSILLLWPIIRHDPTLNSLFGLNDKPAPAGKIFAIPALGDTLERFATQGPDFLRKGDGAQAMFNLLGENSRMTPTDLEAYQLGETEPIVGEYHGAQIYVPGPPSQAGAMVISILRALKDAGPLPEPLGPEHVIRLAQAMEVADNARGDDFVHRLFEQGFVEGWLAAGPPGFTTHLNAVDDAGNAIAITSSLGETAGLIVEETGIILNNFLGEDDVNPPDAPRPVGARLLTMCCPTLLEDSHGFLMMGSGGSSRIRTALMQGIVYTVDHQMTPQAVADAPRCHYERGALRIESMKRPAGYLPLLQETYNEVMVFDEPGLFFGGLHMAGIRDGQLVGAGDDRRSGTWDIHNPSES